MVKLGVFLALVVLATNCRALVPIVGWSNRDAFSSMRESHYTSANDFLYSASLDNLQMIVVFKSPELTYDILAKYGGTYGNQESSLLALQNELEISKSSVWAGSDGRVTSDLLQTLSFVTNSEPYVVKGEAGADPLEEVHKLVLVELPAGKGEQGLVQQDKIIGEVMASVGELPGSPSYAAIFSSDDNSVKPQPQSSSHIVKREARVERQSNVGAEEEGQSKAECAKVTDKDGETCLLFCLQPHILVSLDDSIQNVTGHHRVEFNASSAFTSLEFTDSDCNSGKPDCEEYGGTCITVEASGDAVEDTTFTFAFRNGSCKNYPSNTTTDTVGCGFYSMEVYVNGEKYRRYREEVFLFTNLTIPLGSSYACGNNTHNTFYSVPSNYSDLDRKKEERDTIDIYHFTGIQVQAFPRGGFQVFSTTRPDPVFGPAFNCQGYISSVSLMGVVSILVLALILYCSVVFMFSINTLDRFDDPRGPTISVENLH